MFQATRRCFDLLRCLTVIIYVIEVLVSDLVCLKFGHDFFLIRDGLRGFLDFWLDCVGLHIFGSLCYCMSWFIVFTKFFLSNINFRNLLNLMTAALSTKMALRFHPTQPLLLMKGSCCAHWMIIMSRTPFSSMINVCSQMQLIKKGPPTLGMKFRYVGLFAALDLFFSTVIGGFSINFSSLVLQNVVSGTHLLWSKLYRVLLRSIAWKIFFHERHYRHQAACQCEGSFIAGSSRWVRGQKGKCCRNRRTICYQKPKRGHQDISLS